MGSFAFRSRWEKKNYSWPNESSLPIAFPNFWRIMELLAASRPGKDSLFFVARTAGIFAESGEIRFDRPAASTSLQAAPFKIFSKK
jgi:hypothetical protein